MALCDTLKTLRAQKGLTQEKLAEQLNVTRQAVAKWECGATVPELDKLMALADLYQLTLDLLVRGAMPCSGWHQPAVDHERDALVSFLLRAAARTYAGKGVESAAPSRPGSHDLHYAEGRYLYVDTYFGGQQFLGEEALFTDGLCVWGMNYCGRTLGEGFSGDFLKEALLLRPREMPFRGPGLYRNGRYTYHNKAEGDFGWFAGREAIFCDERRVYECVYHGGNVQA